MKRKQAPRLVTATQQLPEGAGVSASSRSPLYYQIYLILRNEITAGTYADGDILPSEFELARIYNVSRITAKRALAEIAAAGLANRFRGRGTVVTCTPHNPPLRASVENWLQSSSAMGRSTTARVLEFGYGTANAEEAAALQIDIGDTVQRSTRVRIHDNAPFSLLVTIVPEEAGLTYGAPDLETTPLLELLRRNGITVGHARQTITATLANQAHAELLSTEIGAPLLKIQRIVFSKGDKPIEYLTALYRPDRYQLDLVLSSDQTATLLQDPFREGPLEKRTK
jgi:GntR family transcriptional regulator